MRVGIYARVSTKQRAKCPVCGKKQKLVENRLVPHKDREYQACSGAGQEVEASAEKGQDTENQLLQLRDYCARQGWVIVHEYIDRLTAKHGERDEFKELFEDAGQRRFDVVLVWALDRFTREGIYQTFGYVDRLQAHGILFESFTEPHFRTTGPAGDLMLAVAAWIAKQERQRISDRTRAGLDRAERAGRKGGRPMRLFDRHRARELHANGLGYRAIGEQLGVSFMTVKRALDGTSRAKPKMA